MLISPAVVAIVTVLGGPVGVTAGYLRGRTDFLVVVRLMHEGHTPEAAEAWAKHVPAFAKALDRVIDAFAAKLSGMWEFITRSSRARPHSRALADTAREWARYRLD
ncbi:hypothetical protein [Embleya sp. NPDC001921]